MKIATQQLNALFQHKLAPIFLLSGDEHFLLQETCKLIYEQARAQGFTNREIFHIETGFNWEDFVLTANNYSLFDENSILELRLNSKITEIGSKALQTYANTPPNNKLLIIITNKLDAAIQKTAWFKAIDAVGVIIQVWPLDQRQLPSWIQNKLAQAALKTDANGLKLLIDHSAGNLLAASQEIDKLRLIYGPKFLSAKEIELVISDNSKYNVFNLVDNMLHANKAHTLKIIENLKNEAVEPTIILWAIVRELRTLIGINSAISLGKSMDEALQQHNIWSARKLNIKKILQTFNLSQLQNILYRATKLDLIIKGVNPGNFWVELEQLFLTEFMT